MKKWPEFSGHFLCVLNVFVFGFFLFGVNGFFLRRIDSIQHLRHGRKPGLFVFIPNKNIPLGSLFDQWSHRNRVLLLCNDPAAYQ